MPCKPKVLTLSGWLNEWQNYLTYRPQSYGCQVNIVSGCELKVFYVTRQTESWGSVWPNYRAE
jgi:hypothetical protein